MNLKRHLLSLKALVLIVATQRAGAAVADPSSALDCAGKAQAADASLTDIVAGEFARTFNIQIDWQDALGVSDDEEGPNCLFSDDSGHVVRVGLDKVRSALPNKISVQ